MSRAARASAIAVPREDGAASDLRRVVGAIVETTKPRITKMVVVTAGVGFALGAAGSLSVDRVGGARSWSLGELVLAGLWCLAGTGLSAAGANSLNQWLERERDARMPRTASRPLPEGRLAPAQALGAGALLCAAGVGLLWAASGVVAASVSLATIAVYLLLYTPLKPVTSLATLVGAVPGALPPLIGWAAADRSAGWSALADPGAWALFLIMFVWQIPHFLAIAWMYRDDYERGGYRMLPMGDTTGRWTAASILVWAVLLVLVTLSPGLLMEVGPGPGYFVAALGTGAGFLYLAVRLARLRSRESARATFLGSIVHLPVLLVVLVVDTMVGVVW